MPAEKFLRAVDTSELQHIIAHCRLDQHRKVPTGRNRDDNLANIDVQDIFCNVVDQQWAKYET